MNFYTRKRVLVTGGTGFIGTHFVEALARAGASVRVPIHRRPAPTARATPVEAVRANLLNAEDCLSVCGEVDYVIHAAGIVGAAAVSPLDQMTGITVNLVVTTQMLRAAWSAGVRRFLLLSSSTVYPPTSHPVREDEAWTAPPHASYAGYGWMKRSLERLAEFVASRSSMRIAVVRPTAVYGRYDISSHVIPALIYKALHRHDPYEVWGTGEEVRDFVHATDLVMASLRALEHYAICDPVNVGSGQPVTISALARAILDATGHDPGRIEFNPAKPTTLPVRTVDISKARRVLGFEPQTELMEGLRDTVRWVEETCAPVPAQ